MSTSSTLPQPPQEGNELPYTYVTYDGLETDWLGDVQRLRSSLMDTLPSECNDDLNCNHGGRYSPGTLVWVLLSKKKPRDAQNCNSGFHDKALHKKRRNKKNKGNSSAADGELKEVDDQTSKQNGDEEHNDDGHDNSQAALYNRSKKIFFLRARVISDDEVVSDETSEQERSKRRVLVRYSKGATYRVCAYNLLSVLEPSVQKDALPPLVVVTPETHIYRRIAKVHTTPEDSFMEIGCDYGITVDKIQTSIEEAGDVPKDWPCETSNEATIDEKKEDDGTCTRVSCVGVDRSIESIDIANQRYPKCKFVLANVMSKDEMTTLRTTCESTLQGEAPSIICVDINGNREIDGVLRCVQMLMNEKWKRQPRMIIVKSRLLYWDLKERKKERNEYQE
mmetsp:Transcript_19854/g.28288  ORF Transcript_19854/g.28288 Transcript_19854/m.28288 type:complete len:393 (-) Transcript_19854:533-1711(-)|eukprot:CAMPEP_0201692268 /NCGR_PEP_ID=MMETSP0578-20130828/5213_1 /ASSEMBLY_ACC=CAM_ASM_000663 /TAXON_ID=267565 /ORGANISM="Skeletonema grethea, Strain CCMP 1804" /LENGTH=392 /DNA_ID=CAMNT_0048177623 /DNA_START=524 /DNA_END=1702 /DNA_ORIENTATION=-